MIEFKQFGIPLIQELVTLPVEDGVIFFKHMCPAGKFVFDDPAAPWMLDEDMMAQEDIDALIWYPPAVVPLEKTDKPEDVENMKWEPTLVWFEDRVERQWVLTEQVLTPQQIIANARKKMAAALETLSLAHQSMLFSTRIAVEDAFDRGRLDIAKFLIENQVVPEEIQPVKDAIIALFPTL